MTFISQYLKPFNCVQKRAQARLRPLTAKCIKSYIFDKYVYTGFDIKLATIIDMP